MAITENLILHLPLDQHTEQNTIPDAAGSSLTGAIKGNTQLIPDETFGACLSFNGTQDVVEVPDNEALRFTGDMALSAWFYLTEQVNDWVRVAGKGDGEARNYGIWYHPVANQWLFQQRDAGGNYLQAHGNSGQPTVNLNKWHHLLGVREGDSCHLYVDGEKIASASGLGTPVTSDDPFLIGYAGYHSPHPGRIAQVRLYDRALSQEEILEIRQEDQTAMATFRQSHPLEFKLLEGQGQAVLYIDESPAGHQLHLNVRNTSREGIQLAGVVHTEPSEGLHHLALHFRPGTLLESSLDNIKISSDPAWRMKSVKQGDGSVIFYLLATHAPKLEAGGTHTISFTGFRAEPAHGSRGTRAELFYQNMAYEGTTAQIRGQRLTHLNIVNHLGKKSIPLHLGFFGSDTILNDAVDDNSGSANSLKLRISNALKADPENPSRPSITLKGKNAERPTKFIISFDVQQDNESIDWALCTKSQAANIEIRPAEGRVPGGQMASWAPGVGKAGDTFLLEDDVTLQAGAVLEFHITNIKSSMPAGHTNLYLHYENIPGYWDGQFVEVIEKSPLIYRSNVQGFEQVGIGTADPQAKLDVNGDIKAKGLTIDGEIWLKPENVIYVDRHVPNSASNWVKGNEKLIEFTSNYKEDPFRGQVHLYAPSAYYTNVPALTLAGNYGPGGVVGIGEPAPEAKLHIVHANQNADGNTLILGPINQSNLRLGYDAEYSWIQSHGAKPLYLNPAGNKVGINRYGADHDLDVNGTIRAQRYYDEDPNFYIDANSTSVMNVIHASIIYDREDTSFLINPSGQTILAQTFIRTQNAHGIIATNSSPGYPTIWAKNSGGGWAFYADNENALHYGHRSTIRAKDNVQTIPDALSLIRKIRGVKFNWKKSGAPDYGFIAEEIGQHIPEAVSFEGDGQYAEGMSYDHIIPFLVEAVKEQQDVIEKLKERIQELSSSSK